MLSPAFLCQDPRSIRHRWLVTHVLTMATVKIGDPITIFVQMKSDNRLMHAPLVSSRHQFTSDLQKTMAHARASIIRTCGGTSPLADFSSILLGYATLARASAC